MADTATLPQPLDEVAPPKGRHGGAAWAVWIARRLGLAVLTLWLVSILVFFATAALGDPVRAILGKDYKASPGRVAALSDQLNLDEPLIQRYLHWLGGILTGDPGTSLAAQQPVGELIGPLVINTIGLVLISAVVMIPVAFGVAMISANYRRRKPDTIIQGVTVAMAGLPEFVTGILLVAVFSTVVFHWLPAVTITSRHGASLGRPEGDDPPGGHAWCIAVAPYVSRIVRSTLLEVLDSDYVELARLKGIPETVVMRKHALLNAIVPGDPGHRPPARLARGWRRVRRDRLLLPRDRSPARRLRPQPRRADGPGAEHDHRRRSTSGVNLVADIASILLSPRARTAISS